MIHTLDYQDGQYRNAYKQIFAPLAASGSYEYHQLSMHGSKNRKI